MNIQEKTERLKDAAMLEARAQADAIASGVSSGSSGGGSGGIRSYGGYDNGDYGQDVVEKAQAFVGASVDGKWGSDSAAKAKAMGYDSLAEVVAAMDNSLAGSGFTGSTYEEAVAYAKQNGVPGSRASAILTKSEFARTKQYGGTRDGANEFDTYAEYLECAVGATIDAYGKR